MSTAAPPRSPCQVSLARVLVLKAEAKALVQRDHIKHCAALARLAQQEGFPSWQRLMAAAGGSQALRDVLGSSEKSLERQRRYNNGSDS